MGRRPRKRRRRHGGAAAWDGPDRLTNLNEDLLRSVLNCLPTRSAARVAAVSRHFRAEVPRLLERMDSLTLHEPHFPVSLRTTPPLLIRRLALAPHRALPPSSFRPIIHEAAAHGLAELSFRLARRARLPKNVLSVKSLVVLALDTCAVPPWSDVTCPCLRTLKLHRVAIHQDNITKILASASCLETLEMEYCTGHGTGKGGGCTVESSSVRNLVLRPTLKQEATVIRAPGLRVLTLYTRSRAKSLELAPAPEIRKVYLHISKSKKLSMESFGLRPFLDAAVKLECLTLRGQAMKTLLAKSAPASTPPSSGHVHNKNCVIFICFSSCGLPHTSTDNIWAMGNVGLEAIQAAWAARDLNAKLDSASDKEGFCWRLGNFGMDLVCCWLLLLLERKKARWVRDSYAPAA